MLIVIYQRQLRCVTLSVLCYLQYLHFCNLLPLEQFQSCLKLFEFSLDSKYYQNAAIFSCLTGSNSCKKLLHRPENDFKDVRPIIMQPKTLRFDPHIQYVKWKAISKYSLHNARVILSVSSKFIFEYLETAYYEQFLSFRK